MPLRLLLIAIALLLPSEAAAHAMGVTHVTATFADGTFVVDVEAHPTPLGAAQRIPDLFKNGGGIIVAKQEDDGGGGLDGEAHAVLPNTMLVDLLTRDQPVRFDGLPSVATVALTAPSEDGTPVVRLTGTVPEGAAIFRWHAPKQLGLSRLMATTPIEGVGMDEWVAAGFPSKPLVFASARSAPAAGPGLVTWTQLGFLHIVPYGLDHILFVLALFLFGAAARPLLLQVTAFTVAHSVTLALAAGGVVQLPASLVEPLIAASIAVVALENLLKKDDRVRPHRLVIVFVFGLLHGAGFANVVEGLGIPTGQRLSAVFGFNVGVELGQMAVLLGAALVVGWARNRDWYHRRIEVPASIGVGAVGLLWAIQRVVG